MRNGGRSESEVPDAERHPGERVADRFVIVLPMGSLLVDSMFGQTE
jgi:hypothetical protein